MDVINKAYGQLVELFRSMTPGARITAGLLLAAIVSSLLYLFRYQTDRTDEYLFGGLIATQSEIVAMEAAFGKHGLSNYEIIGNKVRVPRLQRDGYLAALAEEGALPQNADSPWLTMFQSDSPFDTRDTRERKAKFAKEQSLAHVINRLPDIEEAYVSIMDEPAVGFGAQKTRVALVAVKSLGSKTVDEAQVKAIRHTVATGAGVKPDDVTITDLNGGGIYPGVGKENGVSEFHNIYATYQREYASDYRRQILNRLAAYPGVQVQVHVELDKDLQNQVSSLKYDEKPTTNKSTTLTKESTTNSGDSGNRPGAIPNGVAPNTATQVASVSGKESTQNETREEQSSLVGTTRTDTQKVHLTPVYVSASIGIPRSYFATIWRMKNPTKPGAPPADPPTAELEQIETKTVKEIEDAVVGLLPRPPVGDSEYLPVKVIPYHDLPIAKTEPPSLADHAFSWFFANWQTMGLFGLAVFGVVFLRGMVRAAQVNVPPPAASIEDRFSQKEELEEEEKAASNNELMETSASTLKRRFQTSGRSLRDELTDLVREDPDAAANVLKLWISDAA